MWTSVPVALFRRHGRKSGGGDHAGVPVPVSFRHARKVGPWPRRIGSTRRMYMGKQIVIEISVFNGSLMPNRSDVQNVHDASRGRSSLVLAPAVRCCWCGETLSACFFF